MDFPDFSAKCLQLLIESVPTLAGVDVLWDPSTGALQLEAVEAAAQAFGISVQVFVGDTLSDEFRKPDLPLNIHPAAIRATAVNTPSGAV